MARFTTILFLLIFCSSVTYGQTQSIIDRLLKELYKTTNSKELSTRSEAKQIISFGEEALPILSNYFNDTTLTVVKSECQNLMLNRGEIAIILADCIEYMPYAMLTNIENCLLEFCEGNPNLIEYYLYAIRRDNVNRFQEKYTVWLTSKDRRKWGPYKTNKERKTK